MSKPLRILFVSSFYGPETSGLERSMTSFKHELEQLGHTVYIATSGAARADDAALNIIRIPAKRILYVHGIGWIEWAPFRVFARRIPADIDVIHGMDGGLLMLHATRLATRAGIPIVYSEHADRVMFYERHRWGTIIAIALQALVLPLAFLGRIRYRDELAAAIHRRPGHSRSESFLLEVSRLSLNGCDGLVVPSYKTLASFRRIGVKKPVAIIPTGVIEERSIKTRAEIRKAYHIPSGSPLVLFVGRLVELKAVDLLLEAFNLVKAQMPDARLLIVGGGEDQRPLERIAERLNLAGSVIFTGQLDHSTTRAIYSAADIFAFLGQAETQGLVFNEACLAGLPIVFCDALLEEFVKDRVNGLLALPEPQSVATKINELINNSELRHKLGVSGRKIAKQFEPQHQAIKLLDLYEKVIKPK